MRGTVAFKLVAITLLAVSTHFVSAEDDLWKDCDKDNSGSVTASELKEGFKKHNVELTDDQVKEILHVADYNNDGTLNQLEFQNRAAPYLIFRKFDKNNDGYVVKDELKDGYQTQSVDIKQERIEEVFKIADENHDGKINYREFVYNVLPYLKFDKFDVDKSGTVTKEELKTGFATLKITLTDETLKHVYHVGDRNNDGHISYPEYAHRVDIFFVFYDLDKDKSGVIDAAELREGLARHGVTLDATKAKEIIDIADMNDDGSVKYREFLDQVFPYFRFLKLDTSKDGEVTKEEMGEGLKLFGIVLDDARLTALMKVGDTNGDNHINYAEYVRKVDQIFYFRRFDMNNNGLLDKTELKEGFELHGITLDAAQLDALFAVADSIRNDQHIDYEEFVRKTYPYFIFRKFDTDRSGCISKEELQKGLKFRAIMLEGEKLDALYNAANTKGSDNITYDEFVNVIIPYIRFVRFDKDKCGEIDADELSERGYLFGKKITKEEATTLIAEAEEGTKNGKLSFKEYLKIDSKIV